MDQQPENRLLPPLPTAYKRKLVTIRPITEVRHLSRPKRLDLATVRGGWTVIVTRHLWNVGDVAVYFEIDSFVPYKFRYCTSAAYGLMEWYQGVLGYHVRSDMVGKHISQGLILSIERSPKVKEVLNSLMEQHGPVEGMRMAEELAFEDILGIKKWEPSGAAQGQVLGLAPPFFRPPGCDRVQNLPDLFTAEYLDRDFQVTEKIDGVSMTVYRVEKGSRWHASIPALPEGSTQEDATARVGVASREEDLDERGDSVYWQAAKLLDLPTRIHKLGIPNIAIQGELIGPTIKKNSLGFAPNDPHQFIVFQIYLIDAQSWIDLRKVVELCEAHGLLHVPVIGYFRLREFATNVKEMLAKVDGVGYRGQTREGLVFKHLSEKLAFKAISNKWLLEKRE